MVVRDIVPIILVFLLMEQLLKIVVVGQPTPTDYQKAPATPLWFTAVPTPIALVRNGFPAFG